MKKYILREILNKLDFLIARQSMMINRKTVLGKIEQIAIPGEAIYEAWKREQGKKPEPNLKLEEAIKKEKESKDKPDEKI